MLGSPPPTRGKPLAYLDIKYSIGITPAYAGKTATRRLEKVCLQDHPRLRGENFAPMLESIDKLGSPPPTRGKLMQDVPAAHYAGITPAYAGKTFQTRFMHFSNWDHPRLRGEN